jgi:hypothetical protein
MMEVHTYLSPLHFDKSQCGEPGRTTVEGEEVNALRVRKEAKEISCVVPSMMAWG